MNCKIKTTSLPCRHQATLPQQTEELFLDGGLHLPSLAFQPGRDRDHGDDSHHSLLANNEIENLCNTCTRACRHGGLGLLPGIVCKLYQVVNLLHVLVFSCLAYIHIVHLHCTVNQPAFNILKTCQRQRVTGAPAKQPAIRGEFGGAGGAGGQGGRGGRERGGALGAAGPGIGVL